MRLTNLLVPTIFSLASLVPAQKEIVRGEVRTDFTSTAGSQFFLHCTGFPIVSSTVALDALVDKPMLMTVVNIGSPRYPVLDVRTAVPTIQVFELSKLRTGQMATGQVSASSGSFALVYLETPAAAGWTPIAGIGVWLLGMAPPGMASGFVGGNGQFQFQFKVPMLDALVGTTIMGQALVVQGDMFFDTMFFSNPDCRTVVGA